MKTVILNGNPDAAAREFDRYLDSLSGALERRGHAVTRFDLRDMDIKYCTGCWGCWVKTPGECAIADDTVGIRDSFINSDLVIHASPVRMGFITALLKQVLDKTIPLLHPYITFIEKECHHRKRYDRYPKTGLILERSADTDDEDIDIITAIYRRVMLDLHSELVFALETTASPEEAADEADSF